MHFSNFCIALIDKKHKKNNQSTIRSILKHIFLCRLDLHVSSQRRSAKIVRCLRVWSVTTSFLPLGKKQCNESQLQVKLYDKKITKNWEKFGNFQYKYDVIKYCHFRGCSRPVDYNLGGGHENDTFLMTSYTNRL